jgi:hypothetical protein
MQKLQNIFSGGSKSNSVVMIGFAVVAVVIITMLLLKKK